MARAKLLYPLPPGKASKSPAFSGQNSESFLRPALFLRFREKLLDRQRVEVYLARDLRAFLASAARHRKRGRRYHYDYRGNHQNFLVQTQSPPMFYTSLIQSGFIIGILGKGKLLPK